MAYWVRLAVRLCGSVFWLDQDTSPPCRVHKPCLSEWVNCWLRAAWMPRMHWYVTYHIEQHSCLVQRQAFLEAHDLVKTVAAGESQALG